MKKGKPVIVVVLALMVMSLAGATGYFWYNNSHYIKTEDARVNGDIYRAAPQLAGEIIEVKIKEGDTVRKGQVLARLEDTALHNVGNTDLTLVKSPVDGLVIKQLAHAGEIGGPGQPLAMIVNPEALYITANIEETKLHLLQFGQVVDITLDNRPGQRYSGRVDFIGEATLSTFSLLPSSSAGGNFTKIVQRIPVRIEFDATDRDELIFGANARVKIHVR